MEVDERDVRPTFGHKLPGLFSGRRRAGHCRSFKFKKRLHQLADVRRILDEENVQVPQISRMIRRRAAISRLRSSSDNSFMRSEFRLM